MSLLASNCNRLSLCFVWFLMGVLHCKPDHGLLLMRLGPGLALELKKKQLGTGHQWDVGSSGAMSSIQNFAEHHQLGPRLRFLNG
jgi:hypothetical protein